MANPSANLTKLSIPEKQDDVKYSYSRGQVDCSKMGEIGRAYAVW